MMSASTLIWGIIFGSIGLALFVYGKKQKAFVPLFSGIGLMVVPYFISTIYFLVLSGMILTALPFILKWQNFFNSLIEVVSKPSIGLKVKTDWNGQPPRLTKSGQTSISGIFRGLDVSVQHRDGAREGVLKPLLIMPVLVGMGNIGVNMTMLVDEIRLYQDVLPV